MKREPEPSKPAALDPPSIETSHKLFCIKEEFFPLILESLKDYAIFTCDKEGGISSWNSGAESILQYKEDEIIGRNIEIIFTPEDVASGVCRDELETALTQGRALDERFHVRKDGSRFWAGGFLFALKDDQGAVRGLTKIIRDLTAQKRMEDELKREKMSLGRVNEELENLNHIAGHDLKAPLRNINTFAGLLRRRYGDKMDAEGREMLDLIESSVNKMNGLLTHLLDLSKVSKLGQPYQEIGVGTVVGEIKGRLETDIRKTGARIDLQEGIPPIHGDPVKLTLALSNLINNAIKFSSKKAGEKPRVKIGYVDDKDFHTLFVKDNGIGIPEEYHGMIFEPFKRLHGESEYEGAGVGLSIVKKIVEQHKGKIALNSKPGKGSTFYLSLPKAPPA